MQGQYTVKVKKSVEGWEIGKEYYAVIGKIFLGKMCIFKGTRHFSDNHAGYKTFNSEQELLEHFETRTNRV